MLDSCVNFGDFTAFPDHLCVAVLDGIFGKVKVGLICRVVVRAGLRQNDFRRGDCQVDEEQCQDRQKLVEVIGQRNLEIDD